MAKRRQEKVSIATEIDRVEERRALCRDSLDRAEYRRRREELCEQDRQALEEEMTILNGRLSKYDQELAVLRAENRKNMLLSVALLAVCALIYFSLIY
ncbi:coiled-coil domain-containing protein 167 [Lepisosteus oculatus]|uniref:coiled-coil domain-containing protein 167 n=1 Tax=Lepisosteus oculatus TaxID=7918 RepID=UPI0035F50F06